MSPTDAPRTALFLLTGFLGSGKTTLLNHWVQQPEARDTLVIINEFGAIALDHHLVTQTEETLIVELDSGCVCCTVRHDLQKTLRDISWRFARGGQRQFRQVVVETTGLADPAPIMHTLINDAKLQALYTLEAVVTVVDAANAMATLDTHPAAVKQVALADRLLLSKTDVVPSTTQRAVRERLANINPGAAVDLVEHGRCAQGLLSLLGQHQHAQSAAWLRAEAYTQVAAPPPGWRHHPQATARTLAHDGVRSFCFVCEQALEPALFNMWWLHLFSLHGESLLRVKGLVHLQGQAGPTVIHGVQHVFHPPQSLPAWPSADHRTRIVFITVGLEPHWVQQAWAHLNVPLQLWEEDDSAGDGLDAN